MLKIGVMSDTHGHLDLMREAAEHMQNLGATYIIHLGDDLEDAKKLEVSGYTFLTIPGIFEKTYQDPDIPNRLIEEIGGVKFLLSHTPERDKHDLKNDLDPIEVMSKGQAQVLLHGHTHVYQVEKESGWLKINPGHLNPKDKRGRPLTFALLELDNPTIRIKIIGLDGTVYLDKETSLA